MADERVKVSLSDLVSGFLEDKFWFVNFKNSIDTVGGSEKIKLTGQNHRVDLPAGESILIHRAVVIISDEVYHYDPGNPAHLGNVAGVSYNSGIAAENIGVITAGVLDNMSLTANKKYFAIANGSLIDSAPVSGIVQEMGHSTNTGELIINIKTPIILA